jgi:hypothetical protein
MEFNTKLITRTNSVVSNSPLCKTKTSWRSWWLTKRFRLDLTRGRNLALIKSRGHNSWLWRYLQMGKQFRSIQKKSQPKSYKMSKKSITLMGSSQRSKRKKLKKLCNFRCCCKKSRWENKYFNNSCLPFSNRITNIVLIKPPEISKIQMESTCHYCFM